MIIVTSRWNPHLQTPTLIVTYLATRKTFHNVGLCALISLMADLVTFKAKLGIAVERIVSIATAQDAIWPTALIGTLLGHVTKLLTIATLDRRIRLDIVSGHLILETREHIILHIRILFACHRLLRYVTVRRLCIFLVRIDVPTEVHIALHGASWYDQIWISLGVYCGNVVVSIISTPNHIPSVVIHSIRSSRLRTYLKRSLALGQYRGLSGFITAFSLSFISVFGKKLFIVGLPDHSRDY